jgi:hypothetical protein
MAEGNSSGRLDRIESILESMAKRPDTTSTTGYQHEDRLIRIEVNFERLQESEIRLNERVDKLVSSIGQLFSVTGSVVVAPF